MDEKKLDGLSFDNVRARIEEFKRMFPEAVHEGRLDYDTLMALLGDEFDNEGEKYQFTWKGKLNALRLAQKRSSGTLRPDFEESRDFTTTGNLYIEGDNLEVLKLLQQGYLRKVKMIYIDPPYNTGNDFVYEDDFADPIAKYKELTGQGMRANPETAGRYHSNWLNMMYPRLKIAKTLLRDDGVIFISIDDNEVHNLRKLCDEVFGEENFLAQIVWEKRVTRSNNARLFASLTDYIVVYRRSEAVTYLRAPRTEKADSIYSNPDNDPRGVWTSVLYVNPATKEQRPNLTYTIINPISGKEVNHPTNAWKYEYERHLVHAAENRLYWGRNGENTYPRLKKFLSEVEDGMVPVNLWKREEVGTTDAASKDLQVLMGGKFFDFPKTVDLIKAMIQIAAPEGNSIILDFFSGSATTAHAVMQLNAEDGGNRKFIMVQIPEPTDENSEAFKAGWKTIADIGRKRIRMAGDRILKVDWPQSELQKYALNEMKERKKAGAVIIQDEIYNKETGMTTYESKFFGGSNFNELREEKGLTPPDVGFRVFKLDSSNLQKWDDSYVSHDQIDLLYQRMEQRLDRFKHDRRDIDVVYEVFLKYGVPLTEKLSMLEIQGKKFYVVGEEGDLFICLDEGLTVEVIEEAARYVPKSMIFADNAFVDDNEIINAGLVMEKVKIEFRWI